MTAPLARPTSGVYIPIRWVALMLSTTALAYLLPAAAGALTEILDRPAPVLASSDEVYVPAAPARTEGPCILDPAYALLKAAFSAGVQDGTLWSGKRELDARLREVDENLTQGNLQGVDLSLVLLRDEIGPLRGRGISPGRARQTSALIDQCRADIARILSQGRKRAAPR